MSESRTKPYLRERVAGDPCDFGDCEENKTLLRVNPKGEYGIFMCEPHARISWASQISWAAQREKVQRDE